MEYSPHNIEKKWQKHWEEAKAFEATLDPAKQKFYALVEFPYPSAEGLHVGHPRSYTALDIICRKRRMQGQNVLFPMGWDAFGLPTENFAIKQKIHPKTVTKDNIARFTAQLKALGYSFDWSREVDTTDPVYYKWTQAIFLRMYNRGLAYKTEMPINWCTSCKVGLANEEVVNGECERCGAVVTRKVKSQWMLKITAYAERLLNDLDTVDYIERVKAGQRNWIGKSTGAMLRFAIAGTTDNLEVFTTRADTVFGATYMVIAPEHPLVEKYKDRITNLSEVTAYQKAAAQKSDFERGQLAKEKTGVKLLGLACVNPATNEEIPIWLSDYVLISYGTGAIMAVPGHDERDHAFAKAFNMPIVQVITSADDPEGVDISESAYTDIDGGVLINSGFLNGLPVREAQEAITKYFTEKGLGEARVNYKLRDWVFSRQRYWGEPIPIVDCPECGFVPLKEADLPLLLPEVDTYEPTDDGSSPLAKITHWVNTACPKCGRAAKRETDTMPQWAGSSWYFLRYTDPQNPAAIASREALDYFMPVDWYNGGMEHTTLHLLYSRFWHKFLYDEGLVNTPEPYMKRTSQGMILGENNEKMSKSRGNVVNPDDLINAYGADTLRTYEMFIGAFDMAAAWSSEGVRGCRRFLDRVWRLLDMVNQDAPAGFTKEHEKIIHRTIKKVTEDYEALKFNTAIAAMMSLVNEFYKTGHVAKDELTCLITLLNPVAPHITEELNEAIGNLIPIYRNTWPVYAPDKITDDIISVGVTVNGKVKGQIELPADASQEDAQAAARTLVSVQKAIEGKEVIKEVYVKGRLLNIVMR